MIKKSRKVPLRQISEFWKRANSFTADWVRVYYSPNNCGFPRFSVVVSGGGSSVIRHSIKRNVFLTLERVIAAQNSRCGSQSYNFDIVITTKIHQSRVNQEQHKVDATITSVFATIRQSFNLNTPASQLQKL